MNIKQFPKFFPNELSTFLMKEFCITGWQDLNSPQYLFISPFNKEQALGIELSGGKSLNSALFSMCLYFSVVLNLARHIAFLFMVNICKLGLLIFKKNLQFSFYYFCENIFSIVNKFKIPITFFL